MIEHKYYKGGLFGNDRQMYMKLYRTKEGVLLYYGTVYHPFMRVSVLCNRLE